MTGGYGNYTRNIFGDQNTFTTNAGNQDIATNFLGDNNTLTSTGGYFNGSRNIVGSGNQVSSGGPGSNANVALNILGGGNIISAGGSGSNLTAGFNFFGDRNTVAAGPGPLALAGSVFRDGQNVTKTDFGVAINNFRLGGASAAASTSGQSGTVRKAQAVSASTTGPRKLHGLDGGSHDRKQQDGS